MSDEQIALVRTVAAKVSGTQPQWSAALTALLDRLSAAEKARDAWQEAFNAAYTRAIRQVERVRINARGDAYDAHNQAVEICLAAIRALSPLTALPQTTTASLHED